MALDSLHPLPAHTHHELSACDRVIYHFEEFAFSDAQDLVRGNSRAAGDAGDT